MINGEAETTGDESIPLVSQVTPKVYAALHKAITGDLVCAAHDLSEGGLLVCAAEMCIGGRLGLELNMDGNDLARTLFAETTGCFLVEVEAKQIAAFESALENIPMRRAGTVSAAQELRVSDKSSALFALPVDQLVAAWGANQ